MGKVLVKPKLTNLIDFGVQHRKLIPNPEHGDKLMSEEYAEGSITPRSRGVPKHG